MKAPIAMFDIADGEFTFYNEKQWTVALAEWRTELREYGHFVDHWDEYDIVKMKFGDEVFVDEIPQNIF